MGRALVFMQKKMYPEAEAEFTYLIDFLKKNLAPDDKTGEGALAAAYANRGIVKDRRGRYEEALKDYIESIKVDTELAEGPGWLDHLLYYDRKPSSVIDRARYLHEQLQLPESERLLRVPEIDDAQRMYKP